MNSFGYGTIWALGTAIAAFALGSLSGWRITKNIRAPASVQDTLLSWDESPVSTFRQDPFVALVLAAHDLAVGVMGGLAVLVGIRALLFTPQWLPPFEHVWSGSGTTWLIYYAVVALSAVLAWYIVGARWVLPMAGRRFRPIHVVLAEEGVYWGQLYMPWEVFAPLRQGAHRGLIHLNSSKCDSLVVLTLRPPMPDLLSAAHRIIQGRVPALAKNQRDRWYSRKAVFGLAYLLTALPIVAVGIWLYPSSALWMCAVQGIGPWCATWLGARVLQAYQWSKDGPRPVVNRVQA